jgi:hypothetical protein
MIKTIYLNTAINCNKITTSGGKNLIYSFDIPPTNINKNSKLKVMSLIHNHSAGTGSKLNIILKIKDIQYNNETYFGNDGFFPTIVTMDTDKPSYYNGVELILNKQNINFINLIGTDNIADINSGIDASINFCIILQIEDA